MQTHCRVVLVDTRCGSVDVKDLLHDVLGDERSLWMRSKSISYRFPPVPVHIRAERHFPSILGSASEVYVISARMLALISITALHSAGNPKLFQTSPPSRALRITFESSSSITPQ